MPRKKNIKRKVAQRKPKRKIYVYTEGQNTEPQYIKAYEKKISSTLVEICAEPEHGVPHTLLNHAGAKKHEIKSKAYKRENGDDDQVWIVCDRDDHPMDGFINEAKAKDINLAFSNPCFEVWLILHHENYDKDEHRSDTQKKCEEVCVGYNSQSKKIPIFDTLLENVKEAEKRAIALETRRSEDGSNAPVTSVYKLTQAMRNQ